MIIDEEIGSHVAWTDALKRVKTHLLFVFHDKVDRIWKLRFFNINSSNKAQSLLLLLVVRYTKNIV